MKKLFAAVLITAMVFPMSGCKALYQLDPASKTEQELRRSRSLCMFCTRATMWV